MKTKIFSLALAVLFISSVSYAKIRRVGYSGNPVVGTDYSDLQSAHDSASAKDTIMIYPGSWSCNVSKKLIFIGPGYFLTGAGANAGLQNITGAVNAFIQLLNGADSSIFEGIDALTIRPYYDHEVSKIIIRRCHGTVYTNTKPMSNWIISQCFLDNIATYWSGCTFVNLTVSNSYIENFSFENNFAHTGQFNNCILVNGTLGNGGFLLKNTILIGQHGSDGNCVYQNSMGRSDSYPIPTGNSNKNITYANMVDSVFVGYAIQGAYSNDGIYVLKTTSPAKGAGVGGTDMGMFGGTNPYKLSGIPKIPAFYKLTAPSNTTSTNPYTVTFSVRSNN